MNPNMPKLAVPAILLAAGLCASAQENAIVAKLTLCNLTLPAIEKMSPAESRRLVSWFEKKTGCEFVYLLSSDDEDKVVRKIDTQTVKMDSITDNEGRDLWLDEFGHKTWDVRSEAHYSFDYSHYAALRVFVATETPMLIPNIKGSVNVKAMGKPETVNLVFNTAEKGREQTAGPLTIIYEQNSVGELQKTGYRQYHFDSRFNPEDCVLIRVEDENVLFGKLTLEDGGKCLTRLARHKYDKDAPEIEPIAYSTVYGFSPAPKTPEFTLSVTYYTELQDVTVPFGWGGAE